MFQYLRDKPRILVTGIARSGTTICAEMIAHDTGHGVVREELLDVVDPYKLGPQQILQAPVLLEAALEMKARNWHVIVLIRDFKDCADSVRRALGIPKLEPAMVDHLLKKKAFLTMLLDSDMAPMAVRYEDLKLHPLWVEDRKGWNVRQTKSGPIYRSEMGLA